MFVQPGMSSLDPDPDPGNRTPEYGSENERSGTGAALPMLGGIDDAWFGGPSDALSRISSAKG